MTLTTISADRVNLGRNVAPDPWQHFGESGSKAADASWTNPVAIDMTQYTSLMIRMNFTGALAATELQFSLSYGAADANRLVQFMDDDGSIADFTLIPSVSAIGANDSVVIQLGNPVLPLTGIDELFVSIKNKNAGAIVATSIEYCRIGFKPQG